MNRQQRRAAERRGAPPSGGGSPMEDQAYAHAEQLMKAGRGLEAEQLCRQILARVPRHAGALHLAGLARLQAGQPQAALELMDRAIAADGQAAPFHNNRGSALRALGRTADAAASFRKALALRPDYVRALLNLGRELTALGQTAEAIEVLTRAHALAPLDLEGCFSLAVLFHGQGALDRAADYYSRCLRIAPGSVEVRENLAKLLLAQGRTAEAIVALRAVLELKPASGELWGVLAGALGSEVRLSEAADAYRQAVRHQPDLAAAYNGLGNTLADLGDIGGAVEAYRRSVLLQPADHLAHSNLIMTLHELPGVTGADILAEARRFAAQVEPRPTPALRNTPDPERRLRIGYISADFRDHPVGHFLDRVLHAHDPAQVEVFLYSDTQFPDPQTERLRAAAHQWRPIVGLDHAQAAARIQSDGVDLLIDLAGHTGYNRLPLFALRPAPVQASWLGYFGTTGLDAMDYIVADDIVLPPGEDALFSEQPIRLRGPYLCWAPPRLDMPVAALPALQQGVVTFGCFNNRRKINEDAIALWSRILRRAPGSRLFLKSWSLADAGNRAGLIQAFAAHGVAEDRLIFEGLSPRAEGLMAYNRVDIALDPFPFGGCTTTADTLWMGVPVVALDGARWSGRMSRTILASMGLEDWVAADADAYVETALRLAGDLGALAQVRAGLRSRLESSPFCDGPDFTRHLEAAYRTAWRRWCGARQA